VPAADCSIVCCGYMHTVMLLLHKLQLCCSLCGACSQAVRVLAASYIQQCRQNLQDGWGWVRLVSSGSLCPAGGGPAGWPLGACGSRSQWGVFRRCGAASCQGLPVWRACNQFGWTPSPTAAAACKKDHQTAWHSNLNGHGMNMHMHRPCACTFPSAGLHPLQ
jgi:hypothetical protein